jgi:hypothetical protein
MTSYSRRPEWEEFKRKFSAIARHNHRYDVFRDFVTMGAITYHNAVFRGERRDTLEKEYLSIVKRYTKEDTRNFCELLGCLVKILNIEPWDAIGRLYMELEVQNETAGQFFTPPELSEVMARIVHGEKFKSLATKPFITLHEPACGAGGMILAFVKCVIQQNVDPARKLWVEAWDIDRTVALMCYLQLAMWNVPAKIVVGNTLTMQVREVFYTPAHALYGWKFRLAIHDAEALMASSFPPKTTPAEPTGAPIIAEVVASAQGEGIAAAPVASAASSEPPPERPIVIDLGAIRTQAQLGLF